MKRRAFLKTAIAGLIHPAALNTTAEAAIKLGAAFEIRSPVDYFHGVDSLVVRRDGSIVATATDGNYPAVRYYNSSGAPLGPAKHPSSLALSPPIYGPALPIVAFRDNRTMFFFQSESDDKYSITLGPSLGSGQYACQFTSDDPVIGSRIYAASLESGHAIAVFTGSQAFGSGLRIVGGGIAKPNDYVSSGFSSSFGTIKSVVGVSAVLGESSVNMRSDANVFYWAYRAGKGNCLCVRRVNGDTMSFGSERIIASYTNREIPPAFACASKPYQAFACAWQTSDKVYYRQFTAQGTTTEKRTLALGTDDTNEIVMESSQAGRTLVAYLDKSTSGAYGIYCAVFGTGGQFIATRLPIRTSLSRRPSRLFVNQVGVSHFLVAWNEVQSDNGLITKARRVYIA